MTPVHHPAKKFATWLKQGSSARQIFRAPGKHVFSAGGAGSENESLRRNAAAVKPVLRYDIPFLRERACLLLPAFRRRRGSFSHVKGVGFPPVIPLSVSTAPAGMPQTASCVFPRREAYSVLSLVTSECNRSFREYMSFRDYSQSEHSNVPVSRSRRWIDCIRRCQHTVHTFPAP